MVAARIESTMGGETHSELGIGIAQKVAFLRCSDSYPERPETVQVKETHMSWVFLTNAYAYKLKKPVRYPFLDFSTIDARHVNCERELELNRRLAPGIYLGLVPLTLDEHGELHLGDGGGTTVDWMIKMRRLPAEHTLENAILRGSVRRSHLHAVVTHLAAFYNKAAPEDLHPDDYVRRFKDAVASDRSELARPSFDLPALLVANVASAQLEFLATHGVLLRERAQSGRIVEGHGDLRPEHIYLSDRPRILDCLEFNREFRILDPADELAFLAMECDRLGDPSIGPLIFEAYTDQTGDAPAPPLIAFYKCFRAYLRAKLAIWHLDEPDVAEPAHWRDRACDYLWLAERYAESFG